MYRKNIKPGDTVYIGKEGERNAQLLVYDISQEIALYGPGVAQVLYQRPGESEAYPVAVEQEGNEVHWLVTATDTAIVGRNGHAELRYYVGETLAKAIINVIHVTASLGEPGEVPELPGEGWFQQVLEAGAQAQEGAMRAEKAILHQPIIRSGTWWTWNPEAEEYEDTNIAANGTGGVDGDALTAALEEALAQAKASGEFDGPVGPKGEKGEKGDTGAQGPAGPAGKTPEKGVDYWTADDKSAIVNDVLAALPTWTGGAY